MSTIMTTKVTEPDAEALASRPIRVLVFIEAASVTGPAKNLIEFARLSSLAGKRRGPVEVIIATFQRGDSGETNGFAQAARAAGVQVEVIPEKRAFDLSVLRKMRSLLSKYNPDIVQTHHVKSHFLACLLGVPSRYPWIAFHHGYTRTNLKDVVYNQLNRWSLPRARRVVTVCQAFARELEKSGVPRERILVRHNMVKAFVPAAAEQVDELRGKYGISPSTLVGVCVGRLSQEKGHIDLIQALAHLRRSPASVDYRIFVVGNGAERKRLQEEAGKSGVSENIIFVGHDSNTAPYYSLADFAVLPSHIEGSPNALLEAMAAGLPTVCTRVGGVPEIASDGVTVLMVKMADPIALAEAIQKLLTDAALRKSLGENARAASVHFSPDAYCSSILQAYRELL